MLQLIQCLRRVEELSRGGGEPEKLSDDEILELFESGGPTPIGEKWHRKYEKWKMMGRK